MWWVRLVLHSIVLLATLGIAILTEALRTQPHIMRQVAIPMRLDMTEAIAEIEAPKVSILLEISDNPGSLHSILKYFWKFDISVTHIESRPLPTDSDKFRVYLDFNGKVGETNTDKLLVELRKCGNELLVLDQREVPWFPRSIYDLTKVSQRAVCGADLEADHPGFHDQVYRKRRDDLSSLALRSEVGKPIPRIDYTADEISTWGAVFQKLETLQKQFACKEFLENFDLMRSACGFSADNIPQCEDISRFLRQKTGFRLHPVAGLLSSRDFLNGLAFRVFFSTQYIRHPSLPYYTPEPDICHELIGHAPMFADSDFAQLSQEIGLASLGASDSEIKRLAAVYWHSIEFGLLKESTGGLKAYGAGLLSSFGELQYSTDPNGKSVKKPFVPADAASTAFPITEFQPVYFVASSLKDAKNQMRRFCETMPRPFYARYNDLTESIWVDRAIKTSDNPHLAK